MSRSDATTDATTDEASSGVRTEYRGTGVMWSAVGALIVIALVVVVALQNTQDVAFEFLWTDFSVPLVILLLAAIGITMVLDQVVGFVWRRRRRSRLREREELRRLRAERTSGS